MLTGEELGAEEHRTDAATRPRRNWKGHGTLDTFSRLLISHRVAKLGKGTDDLGFLFFNFVRYVRGLAIDHPQGDLGKFSYRQEREVKTRLGIVLYFGDILEPFV